MRPGYPPALEDAAATSLFEEQFCTDTLETTNPSAATPNDTAEPKDATEAPSSAAPPTPPAPKADPIRAASAAAVGDDTPDVINPADVSDPTGSTLVRFDSNGDETAVAGAAARGLAPHTIMMTCRADDDVNKLRADVIRLSAVVSSQTLVASTAVLLDEGEANSSTYRAAVEALVPQCQQHGVRDPTVQAPSLLADAPAPWCSPPPRT